MKIRIVVNYSARYRRGHLFDFVPPITGIHLAALTPRAHEVELYHEQVRKVPVDDAPDLAAFSFFSGFARGAYDLADRYRAQGAPVVAGGPHVTYWQEEALRHFDAIVVGEAEEAWPRLLEDFSRGAMKKIYQGAPSAMQNLPTPRYDLLEKRFVVPRVVQATRGCPFVCDFCSVPDLNPGYRMRPIEHVVRDIETSHFPLPWAEKVAWFWDDNLLVKRRYAKELLREMAGLNKWWLTQASIDIVKDAEMLDLMEKSGCIGIFLGIESLDDADLKSVRKVQNKIGEYKSAIARLHDHGICVMAGFISGFDDQTPQVIATTAERLEEIGVDAPFLSVLTPFRGTPLYDRLRAEDRILPERDWPHYNGYNVAFRPKRMSPDALLKAHRSMWNDAFSPGAVARRLTNGARTLRPGAMMLSAAINGFYGLKQIAGNAPRVMPEFGPGLIEHPVVAREPLVQAAE